MEPRLGNAVKEVRRQKRRITPSSGLSATFSPLLGGEGTVARSHGDKSLTALPPGTLMILKTAIQGSLAYECRAKGRHLRAFVANAESSD